MVVDGDNVTQQVPCSLSATSGNASPMVLTVSKAAVTNCLVGLRLIDAGSPSSGDSRADLDIGQC